MATLAEIIGDAEAEDNEEFLDAVATLVASGIAEETAIHIVWNDGDYSVTVAAVREGWIPTHVVRLWDGREIPVMLDTSVGEGGGGPLYSEIDWVCVSNADFELDSDGTLLFLGQPAAATLVEISKSS